MAESVSETLTESQRLLKLTEELLKNSQRPGVSIDGIVDKIEDVDTWAQQQKAAEEARRKKAAEDAAAKEALRQSLEGGSSDSSDHVDVPVDRTQAPRSGQKKQTAADLGPRRMHEEAIDQNGVMYDVHLRGVVSRSDGSVHPFQKDGPIHLKYRRGAAMEWK
jgi:hypothetical protein